MLGQAATRLLRKMRYNDHFITLSDKKHVIFVHLCVLGIFLWRHRMTSLITGK